MPSSDEELLALLQRPKEMWKQAKLALTNVSSQVYKWWTAARYQGHTRSFGDIRCTCDGTTTLTQQHIELCPRFRECYNETASIHNTQVLEIKSSLRERRSDYTPVKIAELNRMERTLSERLTNVIGTFQGPRIARRARQ